MHSHAQAYRNSDAQSSGGVRVRLMAVGAGLGGWPGSRFRGICLIAPPNKKVAHA
jgi:hypothetical protein